MADDKERFRRALDFMTMLGVSHSVVTPILKRLVKLYGNEWSLIEEENYRALADSYFDEIESKEAKTSARATRKSSRRCTLKETIAELPVPECIPARKKPNKKVTFLQFSEENDNGCEDHVASQEKAAQIETNHPVTDSLGQDITCSYSQELQLECLSFKEAIPDDLVNEERNRSKKPRIDAVVQPSVTRKPELNLLLTAPQYRAKVKEEPLELPILTQQRDSEVSRRPLPAIMSTRNQENQIVLFNKDTASKFGSSEANFIPVKEKQRKKVALLCHVDKGLQRNKEHNSLQSIASAYGSVSDDDSGTFDKNAGMKLARKSSDLKVVRATTVEVTGAALKKDLTLTEREGCSKQSVTVKEEPVLKQSVTVKEEPVLTFDSYGHHNTFSYDCNDISRGQEQIPISVSNKMSSENLPPFNYIKSNITFQNAYISFALARIGEEDCCEKCLGNCIEKYPPCHCARETGGEFAYDQVGQLRPSLLREAIADKRDEKSSSVRNKYCDNGRCLLNAGKCKGHLIRKFVKECWSKCGCSMQCGNRVVQKGISRKLQVSYISKGKGWGLHTLEDLPPGTFVCEYVGEILTNVELDARNIASNRHADHYPTLLDADLSSETILRDEELLCLDATYYGNVARFINHRCYDANLVDIPVEIESPDHHYYHIAFFTTRFVKAMEELTWDYCIDFDDLTHPIKAFKCLCESQHCRGRHYNC